MLALFLSDMCVSTWPLPYPKYVRMLLMSKKLSSYILAIILIGSFFLIVSNLDTRSLWLDEGITFYNSGADTISGVTERVAALDLSPPGYYYLMYFWQEIAGMNTGAFRFLSVIFGVLSVWMTYLLGSIAFRKEVGLIAAFTLAINPFFIGFAQEARMYMMLTFLILLAIFALMKILNSENNAKWWVIFTATNIFGLFTHNFYFFAGFALAMCLLSFLGTAHKRGQTLMAAFVSIVITVVMYLPWLPHFLEQLKVDRYWIAEISWRDVKNYLIDFAGGERIGFYLLAGFAILGLVYAVHFLRKKEFRRSAYSLLILGLFGVLAFGTPIIYSFTEAPLAKVRYFLFVPALVSIVAALGIYSLKKIHYSLGFVPLIALFIIWQPWQVSAYPVEMNEDFRSVAQYVQEKEDPTKSTTDLPIIIHTPSASHVWSFYSQNKVLHFPQSFNLRNYNIFDADAPAFEELVKDLDDFWLLITHSHENPQGILRKWSEERCPQVEEIQYSKHTKKIFLARYSCGGS